VLFSEINEGITKGSEGFGEDKSGVLSMAEVVGFDDVIDSA